MTIQGINSYRAQEARMKLSKKATDAKAVPKKAGSLEKKDTYESATTEDRKLLLESIKKKVKSGFYNSNKVAEELSDSFADVFNQAL